MKPARGPQTMFFGNQPCMHMFALSCCQWHDLANGIGNKLTVTLQEHTVTDVPPRTSVTESLANHLIV